MEKAHTGQKPATITLPNAKLIPAIKEALDEGRHVTFRVCGFSMQPFLGNGRDRAILSAVNPDDVKVGDVVLAEVSLHCYALHRVARREGNDLVLRGDGNPYSTEQCSIDNVLGIAIGFWRKHNKKPNMTSERLWRVYSRLWPSNPFVRRCILAVYRRICRRSTHYSEYNNE